LDPSGLAALVSMETAGELTASQAKAVLAEMVAAGDDPAAIAKAKGYEAMGADQLAAAVDQAIAANPDQWSRFVEGEAKLMSFFVGEVMKATKGQADGKAVTALLRERAGAAG
jgi:aspartyl-tRNA(Asn)/glutamyl-tRNA(Gln) amidotransferase subunit B